MLSGIRNQGLHWHGLFSLDAGELVRQIIFCYFSYMNAPTEEDFFAITLSQNGASYILRGFNLIRWTFVIAMIASVCFLFLHWFRYFEYYIKYEVKGSTALFIQLRIEPITMGVTSLLNILQIIAYFRFVQLCKRGIATRQADMFNNSFKWLIRNAVVACIIVVINLVFAILNIYFEVEKLVNPSATT